MTYDLNGKNVFGQILNMDNMSRKTDISNLIKLDTKFNNTVLNQSISNQAYLNFGSIYTNKDLKNQDYIANVINSDVNQYLKYVMMYFNDQLYSSFNPDITGYTLGFFVMPPLLCFDDKEIDRNWLFDVEKLITFTAIDFTPPQVQLDGERAKARSGSIPYIGEVSATDQLSVTYIDNFNLDIYTFHVKWKQYIYELLEGLREVHDLYMDYDYPDLYGSIDYAASFYIIKCDPSMSLIKYVGKCTGIQPSLIPNKEIIGTRTGNELATFSMTYNCSFYDEALDNKHVIWQEALGIMTKFASSIII